MKVLLLSYHPPIAPGVDYLLPAHLQGLAPHVDFVLLCMTEGPAATRALHTAVGAHCRRIETVTSNRPPAWIDQPMTPAFLWWGLQNVLSASRTARPVKRLLSAPTHFHYSKSFSARLKSLIAEEQPDLVHFQDMVTSTHWEDVPEGMPKIFCPVDSISRWFHEGYRVASGPIDRCARYTRFLETRAWERFVLPKFRSTVVVSPTDARWLTDAAPHSRLDVVPLCVDTDFYRPLAIPEDDPSVLFTGLFTYPANRQALAYFVKDILPGIRREIPSLTFRIVGAGGQTALRGLSDDRRNVVVESVDDIRPAMAAASVSVAPMQSGTGVKLKVLRATAMGRPVVTTREGVEGLADARHGDHLLIADTAELFVEQVVRLLRSTALRQRIGAQARAFIADRHSTSGWANRFLHLYQEAV